MEIIASMITLGVIVLLSIGLFIAAALQAIAPEIREPPRMRIQVRKQPAWYGDLRGRERRVG